MTIDAKALIADDLGERRRERLQHFRPAWLLAVAIPIVGLVATGARDDFWAQPTWILVLQALVWGLALFVLPALGLGLWFPGRAARIALGLVAAAVAFLVAAGPALLDRSYPTGLEDHPIYQIGCGALTLGAGALVLAVCALSGAFAQRRRSAGALWLAAAIALVGIDTTTWHCVITGLEHTLPSHLGAGVLMLLVAGLVGAALHRRQREAA
ncbi:hypothetical protein SAMN02745121_02123 [Nannocystis exedens]|uniref:DUF1109 domain-containing protein n=1 Tax=Nannocystis exedens TaxID=54 RepID=A0A1I1W6X3_9BACT|nr:hypothetical protein [Nannocystis exedens]PCC67487.1 hypothetical protein NAEX_00494 [Nannocystis exedens]SFD90801.1 hypothetical protein SAMN02745121_02123 [Nannocystis exedens]